MKHNRAITLALIALFIAAQFVGLWVASFYLPEERLITTSNGTHVETQYDLPYGFNPPAETTPGDVITSLLIAFVIAIALMIGFMKLRAKIILRVWFFVVVALGIAISLNAALSPWNNAALIALALGAILGYAKIFGRNIIVHNLTELLIYPGVAVIFMPLLDIPTILSLFIIISVYDMYAVWKTQFMQKMAKYQIEHVRVFTGFFLPYHMSKPSKKKQARKVSVAILGGGDVIFPIILSGVVLRFYGLMPALAVIAGATLGLSLLLAFSKKEAYPAMPFIAAGCLAALSLAV